MKHIVIFLNYTRSRLENPVYRIFAAEATKAHDVALLFLPNKLEERDLIHQAGEPTQGDDGDDITFHLCYDLASGGDGEPLTASVEQIRRLFVPSGCRAYPVFIYALMPEVAQCGDAVRRVVWHRLTAINKVATKYHDYPLFNCAYLYHDATLTTLADFLYYTIRAALPAALLSPARTWRGDERWAAVFGSFHISSITYPEAKIRSHLRAAYLQALFRHAVATENPVSTEACILIATDMIRTLPLAPERVGLQEESFVTLPDESVSTWITVQDFWTQQAERAFEGLDDIRRQEWLTKAAQNAAVAYQTRFRQMGVDYFFKLQGQRTADYCTALTEAIASRLNDHIRHTPAAPDAFKAVVQTVINILQQRVLEIQQRDVNLEKQMNAAGELMTTLQKKWASLSLINRMMGKDRQLLEQYKTTIGEYYTCRTQLQGGAFAVKLLNELIVNVAVLQDRCDAMRTSLTAAAAAADKAVADSDPRPDLGIFDRTTIDEAVAALCRDTDNLHADYCTLAALAYADLLPRNGHDTLLLAELRLHNKIDQVIDDGIASRRLPPVLNSPIAHRLAQLHNDPCGLARFVDKLKADTPIPVRRKPVPAPERRDTKNDTSPAGGYVEQWLLITHPAEEEWPDTVFPIESTTSLALAHLCTGLRLTHLEGFAGQRVAIEPTIF